MSVQIVNRQSLTNKTETEPRPIVISLFKFRSEKQANTLAQAGETFS
jgi:hypothetical protein